MRNKSLLTFLLFAFSLLGADRLLAQATITAGGPTAFCSGGSVELTANSGIQYLWSTGEFTKSITVTKSGNYTVAVTITGNQTTVSGPTTVIVKPLTTLTPILSKNACAGTTVNTIKFTGSANKFTWTNSNPAIGLAASGNDSIPSFTATNTGQTPLIGTITVKPVKQGFAYLFVQGIGNLLNYQTVSVINMTTHAIDTTILIGAGGINGTGICVSPDGTRVYIAEQTANAVGVINTADNSIIATIPVGRNPQGLRVSADGSRVYVANATSNNVSVINTNTNQVIATIPISLYPHDVAISPDGTRLYVTKYGSASVSVINTSTYAEIASVTVGNTPSNLIISPDGKWVYVINEGDAFISVISTATNLVTTTIPTNNGPAYICISPDGSRMYTSNNDKSISVINTSGNTIIATISLPKTPRGISVTPDGSELFVLQFPDVAVINTATNTIKQTVAQIGFNGNSNGDFISATGCDAVPVSFAITVNNSPSLPSIAASGPTTFCTGASVLLTSSSATGNQWYKDGVLIAGQINQTYTASTSGTYTVIVSVSSSCVTPGTSAGTLVTVNPLPSVNSITGNTNVCSGLTTGLSNTTLGGVWSSGDNSKATVNTNGVVTGTGPGSVNLTYTVTNSNGCKSSQSQSITVSALPSVATITGNANVCVGSTTTLANSTTSGVWSSSSIAIATVNSNGLVNGVTNGTDTIYYSVTNNFNCTTTVSTLITVGSAPSAPVITIQPVSVKVSALANTSMIVSVTNGTVPRTYRWQMSNNGGSSWTTISSAGSSPVYVNWTTNNLSLLGATSAASGYQYRCIITDSTCGSASTTSNAATLTVIDCDGPTIISNPQNITVNSAAPVIFSTKLSGGIHPYVYQWQVSTNAGTTWNNITSAGTKPVYAGWTDSTVSLSNITTLQNDYRYRCIITSADPCGNFQVTTAAATMSVPVSCLAPVITEGPQQVLTMAGLPASFSVTASGGISPVTYQWQVSKNAGTTWVNISAAGTGPAYSNWTTPALSLQNIQTGNDAFQYRCLVSSGQPCSDSTATSSAAILYVSPCTAPNITASPIDVSLTDATSADFTVQLSGGNPPYSFKWQVSTDNGTSWAEINAAGTAPVYSNWTTATLSLSGISSQHNLFRYRCVVSSGQTCPDAFTVSDAAVLSISSNCFEPSIITPPQSATVTQSSSTSFSVTASGSGSGFTYQWQLSTDGGNTWNNINTAGNSPAYSGYTSSTLSLSSVTADNDNYQYRCIVTNGVPCSDKFAQSNPATLMVSKSCISPAMVSQPDAASVTEGGAASFTVNVNGGTTPYSFQWQVSADEGRTWVNISSAGSGPAYSGWTGATLSLNGIPISGNSKQYRCVIISAKPCAGSQVISDPAKLSVVSACTPPAITNGPADVNATTSDAVNFSVSATAGVTPYSYQWQVSTTNGNSWTTITAAGTNPAYSGWTTARLGLAGISTKNNKYQYRSIVLSGKTCSALTAMTNQAILNVSAGCTAPNISGQPAVTTATVSGTAIFSIGATDGIAPYTYQWQVSTTNGSTWTNISSSGSSPTYANWTTASLKLTTVAALNNNYRYRCIVTSGSPCGNYPVNSNAATLSVTNNCTPPVIDRHPANTSAAVGSATSFSVTVGGLVTYQWQLSKDAGTSWVDISSAGSGPAYANWSTATLSVSGILLANNGFKYRCLVRPQGSCSTVLSISDAANLAVSGTVKYAISATSTSATAGSVSGGGTFNSGVSVSVKATANAGYAFSKWTENGAEVSTEATYTFPATSNRALSATFTSNALSYIDLGEIRIYSDKIPPTGTTRTLSGNVYAIPKNGCTGKAVGVHLPSTVIINTTDNTITGTGEVYCDNVGIWGKVVILNGFFTLKAVGDVFTSPVFNAATLFYKLAGLKLKIADLQVLCDGGKMEGELSLPSEFFSGKINGAINALYFTKSGINLNGNIAFKDLNLKGVIPLDELSLEFDTKTRDYSGSLTLKYPLFSVSGEFAFVNGKFDKIGVEYASNLRPIPLGTLPLAMTQVHGVVSGISTSSYAFNFDATIAPATLVAVPALANVTLRATYLYKDAFDASATLNIFKQDLASARLSVKRDLFTIGGDLNLLNVIKGHADMSIARVNDKAKLTGNFNAGLYSPGFKPLWLIWLNLIFPKGSLIASTNNYITSEYIAGKVTVKNVPLYYSLYYNGFEFDWIKNFADVPTEAKPFIKAINPRLKTQLSFSPPIKTLGITTKLDGKSSNNLSYSFDVNQDFRTIIITAVGKTAPELSVYVAKDRIINAATANQFNNVIYYTESNATVIWIKNVVPGTYYTWSTNADTIRVMTILPSPEIIIKNVVQDPKTRKLKVDFDAYNVGNGATVGIGLDDDLANENGVLLGDSLRAVEGANSVTVDYSKVRSGKFYLYAGITDNIGQHAFSYDTISRKLIADSAPNTPKTFLIERNAGKYFVSFERNNPSPMGYQLHYAGIQEELTLQSPVIPLGDTNYAELRSLPPGRSYRLAVTAMDSIGRQSDLSNPDTLLFAGPGLNNPPYFETHQQKGKIKVGSLYKDLIPARDADNDSLQYTVSSGPAAVRISNQGKITWTPAATDIGYQQIYLQVSDGKGGTDSTRLELLVYDSLSGAPSLSLDKAGINSYTESLVTQLTDPLINNGDKTSSVLLHISSGSDNKGIDVPAIVSTGLPTEFSAPLTFTSGPSSGNSIKVNKGDTIGISYISSFSGLTVQNYAIFKPLRADFILTDSLCSTDIVHLFNASKGTGLRYTWAFGDGITGSDKNPDHLYPKTSGKGNTSYQVKLTITDQYGNTDTVTKTVTIFHVPPKNITPSGPLTFCFGDSVKLTADAADKYLWSTGATSASISVNKSGTYHYISTNGNICFTMDTANVLVNPLPTVYAGANADVKLGAGIQLGGNPTASGNGPFEYQWTPSAGLQSSSISNPLAVPYKPTLYRVRVTDVNGCVNTGNMVVKVTPVIMEDVMFVFPNPATTQVRIEIILPVDLVTSIAIYDFSGLLHKKVIENRLLKKGYQSFLVSIADLAAGTYYIRLNSKQTKMFVKQ